MLTGFLRPAAAPPDIASVSAAHLAGARALTAHLVELGHRDIGVIAGPVEWLAGELLDDPRRPTAIVCFNDRLAVGALQAARERGLRVPEDLSIAGFDDIDLSRATRPALTTVRRPLQEMGRIAVTQLMRVLDGHRPEALHLELSTTLVVRDSTGPVPA